MSKHGDIPLTAGDLLVITVPDPAAGADFTYTIPATERVIVQSVTFTLTNDANAANRNPDILITDGTDRLWKSGGSGPITASQTAHASFASGQSSIRNPETTNQLYLGGLPTPCWLLEGWTIGTETTELQVGDQISDIRIVLRRFINA